jgi:hypothetical protein
MRPTLIMSDCIENTAPSSKYSRMTLAKKQEINVTHISLALSWTTVHSNTFGGETFDQPHVDHGVGQVGVSQAVVLLKIVLTTTVAASLLNGARVAAFAKTDQNVLYLAPADNAVVLDIVSTI